MSVNSNVHHLLEKYLLKSRLTGHNKGLAPHRNLAVAAICQSPNPWQITCVNPTKTNKKVGSQQTEYLQSPRKHWLSLFHQFFAMSNILRVGVILSQQAGCSTSRNSTSRDTCFLPRSGTNGNVFAKDPSPSFATASMHSHEHVLTPQLPLLHNGRAASFVILSEFLPQAWYVPGRNPIFQCFSTLKPHSVSTLRSSLRENQNIHKWKQYLILSRLSISWNIHLFRPLLWEHQAMEGLKHW